MDEFITQLMACEERHYSDSQQQHQQIQYNESEDNAEKQVNIPATPPPTIIHTSATASPDNDIAILTETYGELKQGMVITLDIASACELLHKERRRSDTFRGLQKKLASEYGVDLRITSRKSRKGQ